MMSTKRTFNKVFGIGLSRTGTTSLGKALNQVGVKTVDTPFALYRDRYPPHPLFQQYAGFVDTPIPLLYKELDRRFRGSKFILTTRPVGAWLDSMKWLFKHGRVKWNWPPLVHRYHREMYGGETFDADRLRSCFEAFHDDVHAYFANRSNDLLVLDLAYGYGYLELCEFLGVGVVDGPYPRSNQRVAQPMHKHLRYDLLSKGGRLRRLLVRVLPGE